jgi:hypothetical protein
VQAQLVHAEETAARAAATAAAQENALHELGRKHAHLGAQNDQAELR